MKTEVLEITPSMAEKMIEQHEKIERDRGGRRLNRSVSDNTVTRYQADMAAGNWDENGESIKVAKSGRLLDGQHRLWAAINGNVSFRCIVVSDLDEDVFDTIGIGRTRSIGDILFIGGAKGGSHLAAAARLVLGYERELKNYNEYAEIPHHDIISFVRVHPRLQGCLDKAKDGSALAPRSMVAAWWYLFSVVDEPSADKFMEGLISGANLPEGNVILALRQRLIRNKASRAKLRHWDVFKMGLRTWIDFRTGKLKTKVQIGSRGERGSGEVPRLV